MDWVRFISWSLVGFLIMAVNAVLLLLTKLPPHLPAMEVAWRILAALGLTIVVALTFGVVSQVPWFQERVPDTIPLDENAKRGEGE